MKSFLHLSVLALLVVTMIGVTPHIGFADTESVSIVGSTFNLLGEIIALPFRLVGEIFGVIF